MGIKVLEKNILRNEKLAMDHSKDKKLKEKQKLENIYSPPIFLDPQNEDSETAMTMMTLPSLVEEDESHSRNTGQKVDFVAKCEKQGEMRIGYRLQEYVKT